MPFPVLLISDGSSTPDIWPLVLNKIIVKGENWGLFHLMRVLFLVIALQVIAPKTILLFYSITIKKDENNMCQRLP